MIVGRRRELGLLRDAVLDLAAGQGGNVWIEGETGIGKSTLIRQMTATARECGCWVLQTAADELRQPIPFQALLDCLGIDPSAGPRMSYPVREQILAAINEMCAAQPVMVVLDDMQWADPASIFTWHRLSSRTDRIPLLLVASRRPIPRRPDIDQMRRTLPGRAVHISLCPLAADDTVALARKLLGAQPGHKLSAEIARTGGNPLYILELVEALRVDRLIWIGSQIIELVDVPGAVPSTVVAAITARLDVLGEDTRAMLRVAALLGTEFDVADLAVVTGVPVPGLVAPVEEAIAADVLEDGGDRMLFRHVLVRQVLYNQVPQHARPGLHAAAARMLAEAGRPVGQVATHLRAAPPLADDWVVDWLLTAQPTTAYAAPRIAVDLLRRTVTHMPADDPRRETLVVKLATLLMWLRELGEATRIADEVLRTTTDPAVAGRMALLLARTAIEQGDHRGAAGVAKAALARPDLSARTQSRLRSTLTLCHVYDRGRGAETRAEAARALAEAERVADPLSVGYARHTCYLLSDHETGLKHLDHALAVLGDDPHSVELRLKLLADRALCLSELGRDPQVEQTLGEAIALGEHTGSPYTGAARVAGATHRYHRGAWDEALAEIDATSPSPDPHDRLRKSGLVSVIAGHRGDRATLDAQLGMLGTVADAPVAGWLEVSAEYIWAARALAAESDGDLDAALELLARWLDPRLASYAYQRHRWLPDTVRLALAVGDVRTARAAAEASEADAAAEPLPARLAAARRCRAMLDHDPEALLAAADLYRQAHRPIPVAGTLEETAMAFARMGDVTAAQPLADEAYRMYAGLGAEFDLRRAHGRLDPLGVKRGYRIKRTRATTGWGALTTAELRVAELVATGMSNPEIADALALSRRTVTTHVSHILTKLNARSRITIMHEALAHTGVGGTDS